MFFIVRMLVLQLCAFRHRLAKIAVGLWSILFARLLGDWSYSIFKAHFGGLNRVPYPFSKSVPPQPITTLFTRKSKRKMEKREKKGIPQELCFYAKLGSLWLSPFVLSDVIEVLMCVPVYVKCSLVQS